MRFPSLLEDIGEHGTFQRQTLSYTFRVRLLFILKMPGIQFTHLSHLCHWRSEDTSLITLAACQCCADVHNREHKLLVFHVHLTSFRSFSFVVSERQIWFSELMHVPLPNLARLFIARGNVAYTKWFLLTNPGVSFLGSQEGLRVFRCSTQYSIKISRIFF